MKREDQIAFTETLFSKKFYYYKNDNFIGRALEVYGEYETREIALLSVFCNENTVLYDVGANIGIYPASLSSKVKHVYAFEPSPDNFHLLKKNTKNLKNVTIFANALGNEKKTVFVENLPTDHDVNYGETRIASEGIPVNMFRIDDLSTFIRDDSLSEILPPSIIKIDVEGMEYEVIRGGLETIIRHYPVIFYEAYGNNEKIHNLLSRLEYQMYWFPANPFNPNNYKNFKENLIGVKTFVNMICVRRTLISDLPPFVPGQSVTEALFEWEKKNANPG